MICFGEHVSRYAYGGRHRVDRSPVCGLTFGEWLFHRVFVHAPDQVRYALVRVGLVDTVPYEAMGRLVHDGGVVFWRWDFWRSGYAREWREFRRKGARG